MIITRAVTLALIKPEICAYPQVCWSLIERIKEKFAISQAKRIRFSGDLIQQFYSVHQGKYYYNRMRSHMCSGPSIALILRSDSKIVEKWRWEMGPTKSYEAKLNRLDSIRCQYGLTDHRNAVHGSGTVDEVLVELKLLFPEFNFDSNCSHDCSESQLRLCVFAD